MKKNNCFAGRIRKPVLVITFLFIILFSTLMPFMAEVKAGTDEDFFAKKDISGYSTFIIYSKEDSSDTSIAWTAPPVRHKSVWQKIIMKIFQKRDNILIFLMLKKPDINLS